MLGQAELLCDKMKMQPIYYCVFAIAISVVSTRRVNINDGSPIKFVDTSYGQFDHERIDYLEAEIRPEHVTTNERINFPTSGHLNDYFVEARAPGDERGHLVGSQFSGPAEWYNLSPQNARVNRNAGYRSITTDWYGTECEVRRFLDQGGNRQVNWRVTMTYVDNSNRPDTYHLQVQFLENGNEVNPGIDSHIRNPFLSEDSTFWTCRVCGASKHNNNDDDDDDDELRRRRRRDDDQCTRE